MHTAFVYNVVAAPDGAVLVNAWAKGQWVARNDAPHGTITAIQVQHHSVPSIAGAVEDEPLDALRAHDYRSARRQALWNFVHVRSFEICPPCTPVEQAFYDAQFSPRNMSRSVPIRFDEVSQ